jgi:hypothetical protein
MRTSTFVSSRHSSIRSTCHAPARSHSSPLLLPLKTRTFPSSQKTQPPLHFPPRIQTSNLLLLLHPYILCLRRRNPCERKKNKLTLSSLPPTPISFQTRSLSHWTAKGTTYQMLDLILRRLPLSLNDRHPTAPGSQVSTSAKSPWKKSTFLVDAGPKSSAFDVNTSNQLGSTGSHIAVSLITYRSGIGQASTILSQDKHECSRQRKWKDPFSLSPVCV